MTRRHRPGGIQEIDALMSTPSPAPRRTTHRSAFRWYQGSVASFLAPESMLHVLFGYLVAVVLVAPPEQVGQAQMTLMLPGLVLILVAGVVADRVDQRRMLITLHLANAVPVALLLVALVLDRVSYTVVIAFALAAGSAAAFVQPVLDAMLNRISGPDLQRSVTATVGVMYSTNLLGYLLASTADSVGLVPLFAVYTLVMASGALTSSRLPAAPPAPIRPDAGRTRIFEQIGDGLRTVVRSPRMLPPTILLACAGLFLGGPYMVLVPLMVRDLYGGGASAIAFVFIAFIAGGASSTLWLYRTGGLRREGRGLIAGFVISGLALLLWASHLPLWGYLLATAFWGFGGGLCQSMGRSIMLAAAPESQRARVMSVYHLAGRGTSPIGSLLTGYVVAAVGVLDAALLVGLAMLSCCAGVVALTGIWRQRAAATA